VTALLTTAEAAQYLHFVRGTLDGMRITGEGPPFCKLGRSVRYRRADLDAWVESRVVRSTTTWTEEMVATAAGMKRAGLSTKVIAARLGVSAAAVAAKMSKKKVRRTLAGKPGLGIKRNKNWIDRADHVYEIDKEQGNA